MACFVSFEQFMPLHESTLLAVRPFCTQIKVLRNASLAELAEAAQAWRPTLLYVTAGTTASKNELQSAALQPLPQFFGEEGGC
jgi:hypothetical protein